MKNKLAKFIFSVLSFVMVFSLTTEALANNSEVPETEKIEVKDYIYEDDIYYLYFSGEETMYFSLARIEGKDDFTLRELECTGNVTAELLEYDENMFYEDDIPNEEPYGILKIKVKENIGTSYKDSTVRIRATLNDKDVEYEVNIVQDVMIEKYDEIRDQIREDDYQYSPLTPVRIKNNLNESRDFYSSTKIIDGFLYAGTPYENNNADTIIGATSFEYDENEIPKGIILEGSYRFEQRYEDNAFTLCLNGTPIKSGNYSFTVTYKNADKIVATVTYNMTVSDNLPFNYVNKDSIRLASDPDKLTRYYVGEKVDTTGMKVKGTVYKVLDKENNDFEIIDDYDLTSYCWIDTPMILFDEGQTVKVYCNLPTAKDSNEKLKVLSEKPVEIEAGHFRLTDFAYYYDDTDTEKKGKTIRLNLGETDGYSDYFTTGSFGHVYPIDFLNDQRTNVISSTAFRAMEGYSLDLSLPLELCSYYGFEPIEGVSGKIIFDVVAKNQKGINFANHLFYDEENDELVIKFFSKEPILSDYEIVWTFDNIGYFTSLFPECSGNDNMYFAAVRSGEEVSVWKTINKLNIRAKCKAGEQLGEIRIKRCEYEDEYIEECEHEEIEKLKELVGNSKAKIIHVNETNYNIFNENIRFYFGDADLEYFGTNPKGIYFYDKDKDSLIPVIVPFEKDDNGYYSFSPTKAGDYILLGYCYNGSDNGINWTIDAFGNLEITGNGDLSQIEPGEAPWNNYGDIIRTVSYSEGIIFGKNALTGISNLKSLKLINEKYSQDLLSDVDYVETLIINDKILENVITKNDKIIDKAKKLKNIKIEWTSDNKTISKDEFSYLRKVGANVILTLNGFDICIRSISPEQGDVNFNPKLFY